MNKMDKSSAIPETTLSNEMMKGQNTNEPDIDEALPNAERALKKARLKPKNGEYERYLEQKVKELERRIRISYFNAITALVYALEAKDKYSSGHSQRVASIAAAIAQELGLPPHTIEKIRLAGLIHDIGKIGIREDVLNKPDSLTDEEYQHVISHCEIGEHVLRFIVEDEEILDMVRHHHEHYDGTGFPDGLSGKPISSVPELEAVPDAYTYITTRLTKGGTLSQNTSILSVADAYDAMMSARSYRRSLSAEEAGIANKCGRVSALQGHGMFQHCLLCGPEFPDTEWVAASLLMLTDDNWLRKFHPATHQWLETKRTRP